MKKELCWKKEQGNEEGIMPEKKNKEMKQEKCVSPKCQKNAEFWKKNVSLSLYIYIAKKRF